MSSFFHVLLAFQLLLHAVLGCCAHHGHQTHVSAGNESVVHSDCSHHEHAAAGHEPTGGPHAPAIPLDDCDEPDCSAVKPELSRAVELDTTPAGPLCPKLLAGATFSPAPDRMGAPMDAARRLPAALRAHLAFSRLLI